MSGSRRDHPNEFMESLKEADAIVPDIDHHLLYFLNTGAITVISRSALGFQYLVPRNANSLNLKNG